MPGTLIVLRGLPGSGKSTWARAHVAADSEGRTIVSRDGIRRMLTGHPESPMGNEDHVTTIQQHATRALLGAGKQVLVDDTNLPHRRVRQWLGLAEELGAAWEVEDFTDVDLDTCLARNADRERKVPEDVVRAMHRKFIGGGARTPAQWEPLGSTADVAQGAPYVPDLVRPVAVIVDIDGTLAKMDGRSPYDYDRVGEDLPNTPVIDYLAGLRTHGVSVGTRGEYDFPQVLLMSGRPESCREATAAWVHRHGIHYDELHMRSDAEHKAQVRDDKVKLRLFNEHVRNRYNVHSVLDDRKRVVEMWRGLGLTVLQVDKGDF